MRLVITGASGFIGRQIVPLLKKQGHKLLLVGRDATGLASAFPGEPSSTYEDLAERARGYDALLHLAVLNNDVDATLDEFEQVNVGLLASVVQACSRAGISKVIYPASLQASATGSNYAVTKAKAEAVLDGAADLDISKLRLPIVYGEIFTGKLSVLNRVPTLMKTPLLYLLGSLKPTVHVDKIVEAVETALKPEGSYETYVTDEQGGNWFYAGVKRVMDLGFAVCVIIFLWWLLLAVWLAVKFSSKGPAIFTQQRVGRGGKTFTLYKFRTMSVETKQAATHEVSASTVIPIGGFLRKSKIDELPQIWNIICGDISLVGPRPCLPVQTELVEARKNRGVLDVLPGITGYAQVRGIDMSEPERLARADEEYVKLRTLPLDLKILLATFLGKGNGDRVNSST